MRLIDTIMNEVLFCSIDRNQHPQVCLSLKKTVKTTAESNENFSCFYADILMVSGMTDFGSKKSLRNQNETVGPKIGPKSE